MSAAAMAATLHLSPGMFSREPRMLIEHGAIRVLAFKYASGVEALELSTGAARFILLPFKGQQGRVPGRGVTEVVKPLASAPLRAP